MSDAQLKATLRRLFEAITDEASRNPELARRLAQALGQLAEAAPRRPKPVRRRPSAATGLHAVNVLRLHGEGVLRGRLEQIKAVEELKGVAMASGLVLGGGAAGMRPSRAELIDAIVDAAKHYDAQRAAATA